jgi:hypothetical protein
MLVQNRRIFAFPAWRSNSQTVHATIRGYWVRIDVDAAALVEHKRAKIVDAMGVVGVGMGVKHPIKPGHFGVKQLLAQVGRGVDQHSRDAASAVSPFDQERCAAAAVF